jgi:hypothetical protein
MGELYSNTSPLYIQVHGLPLENLSFKNAIAIGKGLGHLIIVEDLGVEKKYLPK